MAEQVFPKTAPIVLGIISDKNRTASVRITDAIVRLCLPKSRLRQHRGSHRMRYCVRAKIAVSGFKESSSST